MSLDKLSRSYADDIYIALQICSICNGLLLISFIICKYSDFIGVWYTLFLVYSIVFIFSYRFQTIFTRIEQKIFCWRSREIHINWAFIGCSPEATVWKHVKRPSSEHYINFIFGLCEFHVHLNFIWFIFHVYILNLWIDCRWIFWQ